MRIKKLEKLGITELPWKLVKGCWRWLEGKDEYAICEVHDDMGDAESNANAHMLKAAPYLYQALYKMVGTCRTCRKRCCDKCIGTNSFCMKEALEALDMANGIGNYQDRTPPCLKQKH